MMNIFNYETVDQSLWQGRQDTLADERFFQLINCIDIRTQSLNQYVAQYALLGFCSDEGIIRNHGRPGARLGPNALRQHLAGLAYHYPKPILDLGNIVCIDNQLELAQHQLARLVHQCHQYSLITVALGGGHEIAWAHFQGLAPHYPKLGIINIDAHFDIRLTQPHPCSTSGTSFAQIKQYYDELHQPFSCCCLGIQDIANTKSLFERANDWNISYLTAKEMHQKPLSEQIEFIDDFTFEHDKIYLSICLDVFAECYSPGVSAPQSLGIHPHQMMPLLKSIMQSGKVVGLDIAELSPPLDENDKTSRLAAGLLAELL